MTSPGGPSLSFKPRQKNTELSVYLDPETLDLAETIEHDREKYFMTFIDPKIYPPADWRHINDVTFDLTKCKNIGSNIGNVDFFVEADAATIAKTQASKPGQFIGSCQGSKDFPIFALHDPSGEIIASGTCYAKHCDATVWLANHRSVWIADLPLKALPKLLRYRDNITQFLNKRTLRLDPYVGQAKLNR